MRKEERTRLTYYSKGRDVRSMTHKIDGVKNKNGHKIKWGGGGDCKEEEEREKREETEL